MIDLSSLVENTKKFYIENNKAIPNSVVEYIAFYPKGLSRQVLSSKYGLKCSDFVKMLNPAYQKPMHAKDRAVTEATRLHLTVVSDLETIKTKEDRVELKCNACNSTYTTSVASLFGTIKGCQICSGFAKPWYKRKAELEQLLLDSFDAELISDIPHSQTEYLTVRHLLCGETYTTQMLGFVSPNSALRGTCPNCRNTDRRVTVDGVTFGSQFEYACYSVLSKHKPELHVKYSDYFDTDRRWTCDFKIGKFWIEVSKFKQDFKGYFKNIEDKQTLVEKNGAYFFFVRSIKELEELSSLM